MMCQWSQPISGLQINLQAPEGPYKIGDTIEFTLQFKNVSTKYIRIYFINSEPFRFGQSTLYVFDEYKKSMITMQPTPRPHGITITENDFHMIEPNEELEFNQSLFLNKSKFTQNGDYIVSWEYSNKIKKWLDRIKTLNGPTKKLFNGKDIPFIWVGEIETQNNLKVQIE